MYVREDWMDKKKSQEQTTIQTNRQINKQQQKYKTLSEENKQTKQPY